MRPKKFIMEAQILIPSQSLKKVNIPFTEDETVASFRKRVAETVNMSENTFLLIAMGKIVGLAHVKKRL